MSQQSLKTISLLKTNIIIPFMNYPNFLVDVCCMTFNQSMYITDTMNGFCMQETSFPFVCIIVDDASTDGEQDVIKQYVSEHFDLSDGSEAYEKETDYAYITYARHKENKNCYFAVLYLKENHFTIKKSKFPYFAEWRDMCKYEALCEGDDYWVDSLKLQKQVDVMEENRECTICIGITEKMDHDGHPSGSFMPSKSVCGKFSLEEFCKQQFYYGQWFGHTSTFFSRKASLEKLSDIRNEVFGNFPYGDIVIILGCLLFGYGYMINDVFSRYRVNSGGFNSSLLNDVDKAIRVERKLIQGMTDFDIYTENKYHKYIANRILWSQCIIDYHKSGGNGLVYLRPKYWRIAKIQGLKTTFLMAVKSVAPGPYHFIKRMLKH